MYRIKCFQGKNFGPLPETKNNNNQTNLFLFRKWTGNQGVIDHYQNLITDRGRRCQAVLMVHKYWNWCRCIQRKDSAGVILTASWFNNINIGYRFHTSIVCHSCCNNVMYISKENLDISGSAWKKISCWHGIPAGTDCPSSEIIYTGQKLCTPHASINEQPDCGPVLAYYLWHILIFA